MNTSQEKKKLFNLLFQVNDYSKKISELSKEINIIIQKLNLSSLNLNPYIEQLNTTIKSLKSDVKNYYDQFRYNKSNVPKDNELKIYIGFKQNSDNDDAIGEYILLVITLNTSCIELNIKNKKSPTIE